MGRTLSVTAIVVGTLALAACARPLKPDVERKPTPVNASFGRTWDAAVDLIAEANLTIDKIQRESGYLSTLPLTMRKLVGNPTQYDCGGSTDQPAPATDALFNVVVRGDSTTSTVRVNVRYSRGATTCTSQGNREIDLEDAIRKRAEAAK